jgi:hypothetical protein
MEFKKVVAGALVYVYQYRQVLLKALAIPFVAYLLIDAATLLDIHPALAWLLAALGVGVQAIFAITTHRVVLLGPSSVSTWGITSWSKRETFFVLHVIGLGLLMIPISLVGFIPIIGALVALVLICWVTGRLSLVFPGIAVDKGVSFKLSWEMTQNYQMLMFLVVILFPMLLAIPAIILNFIPYTFLLSSFISTFVIVFQVAALSMAYQLISEGVYEKG